MLARIIFCLSLTTLYANPQKPNVVGGSASFSETSRELQIVTRGRTIIDWKSFSIGADEATRFFQDAPVLNRVIGGDPSLLMGLLEANGEIYLLNPQGILVGRDAVIQTAGFIASTLNLDNAAFLAGAKLDFYGDSIASVVFEGAGKVIEEGGRFFLVSNDLTEVSGSIEAANVRVLGDKVLLNETARIDSFSGEVLIGGDYKGKNPDVKNAQKTRVEKGAFINADGRDGEDGGRVIVWADDWTWFEGNISCRGVNGGFVEVSGKQNLHYNGLSDLSPCGGEFGTLLLDPKNILVFTPGVAIGGNTLFGDIPTMDVTFTGLTISTALGMGNLVLEANTDILIGQNISTATANSLTLRAGRDISLGYWNGSWNYPIITLNGGNFTATVNDNGADSMNRDAGAAAFLMRGNIFTPPPGDSQIITNGGNVTISHGMLVGGNVGAVFLETGTQINTGSGRIDITGHGDTSLPVPPAPAPFFGYELQIGVQLDGQLITGAGSSGMTIIGNGANLPIGRNDGIQIRKIIPAGPAQNEIIAVDGLVELIGTGGNAGSNNHGIYQEGGDIQGNQNIVFYSTGMGANAADFILTGVGGNGNNGNIGVRLTGTAPPGDPMWQAQTFLSSDGNFTCTGTGNGTGDNNDGVFLEILMGGQHYNLIESTGTGNISITGFASMNGVNNNVGIRQNPDLIFAPLNGIVTTGTGTVSLIGTGHGSGDSNYGVSAGTIQQLTNTTANAGTITITGVASTTGTSNNFGVIYVGAELTTVAGDLTITGTGGGTGISNHGVVGSGTITTLTAGADAANIFVTGTGSIAGDGIGILNFSSSTMDGDVQLNGTGGAMGNNNTGVFLLACTATGDGILTVTGVAGPGTPSYGIDVANNLTFNDGTISMTGSGGSSGDPGIYLGNFTVSTTGSGDIDMQSLVNSIESNAAINSTSGTITLLAVNNAADILFNAGSLTSGGNFIAAANNDITIAMGLTHTFTGVARAVYIVDEQNPTGVGPGRFDNFGTITTPVFPNDNLAIYAASGPFYPTGVIPGPNQFSSVSPATVVIGKWDSPAPPGANPPTPLNAKYSTSYQAGGPYHGPGFGAAYVPGQGVFGSQVVWYKYVGLTIPGTNIPIPSFNLELIGINTTVDSWQHYLVTPYLPCPILPNIEFICQDEEFCLTPCAEFERSE